MLLEANFTKFRFTMRMTTAKPEMSLGVRFCCGKNGSSIPVIGFTSVVVHLIAYSVRGRSFYPHTIRYEMLFLRVLQN